MGKKDILKLLIEGNSADDILEFLTSKGVKKQNAEKILKDAFDELEARGDIPQHIVIGWCSDAYRLLYRKMYETGDYIGALRAVKQIEALSGKKVQSKAGQTDKEKQAAISKLKASKISIIRRK